MAINNTIGNIRNTAQTGDPIQALIAKLQSEQSQATLANLQRADKIKSIYGQVISRYGEGGAFGLHWATVSKIKLGKIWGWLKNLVGGKYHG